MIVREFESRPFAILSSWAFVAPGAHAGSMLRRPAWCLSARLSSTRPNDAVQIDAAHGMIIWLTAKLLDIQQTVRRIHEDYPHLAETLIEDKVIAWLEMEYALENHSPKQMNQRKRQIERWIKNHRRQSRQRKSD